MADFCKQCSISSFGEDYGDLKGLSTDADTAKEMYPIVICEGCGPIQVDHDGVCVSVDCAVDHATGLPKKQYHR